MVDIISYINHCGLRKRIKVNLAKTTHSLPVTNDLYNIEPGDMGGGECNGDKKHLFSL